MKILIKMETMGSDFSSHERGWRRKRGPGRGGSLRFGGVFLRGNHLGCWGVGEEKGGAEQGDEQQDVYPSG